MHLRTLVSATLLVIGVGVPTTSAVGATTAPTCSAHQMHVTLGRGNGAGGTVYFGLYFTNTGATCTLSGVPAVQPVADAISPRAIGPAALNLSMGQMGALHTLHKGQTVAGTVGFVDTGNYPPGLCHAVAIGGIIISLGSVKHHFVATHALTVCTSRASVTTQLLGPR